MNLVPTENPDVWEVGAPAARDERGAFSPLYEARALAGAGVEFNVAQCAVSGNVRRGTLRGLHFQRAPYAEAKLVRCLRGAIFDVAVDLRPGSPSRGQWVARELSVDRPFGLFIPAGFAHGFVTLTDDTEVLYLLSQPYVAEAAAGIAWNDPALAIPWPVEPKVMSARDRELPPSGLVTPMRDEPGGAGPS